MPLTHDAIQALPNWRTAAYLRDLLMDSGVLPHLDRRLLLFERWLSRRIATTADARMLQHFATWHQLRKLRALEVISFGGSAVADAGAGEGR
ncbi:hypothetical protein GCM10027072_77580 [Streptomyces bullii]